MLTNTQTAAVTTHQRFIRHMDLARLWCRWNAQKGTEKQLLKVMRQLSIDDLTRMLAERGISC